MQTAGACVLAPAVTPTNTMHLAIPSGHRKRPGVPSRRPRETVPPATTEVQHQMCETKRAAAGCTNKREARFVLCAVGGFVSASDHYCRFSDRRLKWGVIRVFRAVRRKCAQIDGASEPPCEPWHILIVDDEPSVHDVTRLTLNRLELFGQPVKLHSAFSAAEARLMLESDTQYCLAFVDVVTTRLAWARTGSS